MEQRSTDAPLTPTGTQAVERAFAVLGAFTDAERVWTLANLARSLQLTKPTVLRLLGALERERMVQRTEPVGAYRLGPRAIEFGALARRANDVTSAARPELERLAWRVGETASLEVLAGAEVLVIDEVRGRFRGSSFEAVGSRWPAHAAATGKVLLAAARAGTTGDWRRFVANASRGRLTRFTDRTVTTVSRLEVELTAVESRGHATAVEELEEGYVGVAAPVRDHGGRVVAALCVGGPATRLSTRRLPPLVRQVVEGAAAVSDRMGGARPGL